MKKMNFTVVALSALLVLGSCGTSQKTGTAAGAGRLRGDVTRKRKH